MIKELEAVIDKRINEQVKTEAYKKAVGIDPSKVVKLSVGKLSY